MSENQHRRFTLHRQRDPTGVSGLGIVAEGVQFTSGWCALHWRTHLTSVAFYPSIEALEAIHGHDGDIVVVWTDA